MIDGSGLPFIFNLCSGLVAAVPKVLCHHILELALEKMGQLSRNIFLLLDWSLCSIFSTATEVSPIKKFTGR